MGTALLSTAVLGAVLLGTVACSGVETPAATGPGVAVPVTRKIVGRWPSGRERVVLLLQDDVQVGEEHFTSTGLLHKSSRQIGTAADWRELDDHSRVRREWQELGRKKHGTEIQRGPDGEIEAVVQWRDGLRDGPSQWFRGGKKLAEQQFSRGAPSGPLVGFWPTGEKRSEVGTIEDRRHGLELRWFPSGAKMAELHWDLGVLHGMVSQFDEAQGYKLSDVRYERGMPASSLTTYYPGGQTRMVVPLLSPRASDGPDAEVVRHGLARIYAEDGILYAELPYDHDHIEGTEKRFAPDGSRTLEQDYCTTCPVACCACTTLRAPADAAALAQ